MEVGQQCYKGCGGSNKGEQQCYRGVTEVTKECGGRGAAVLQGV